MRDDTREALAPMAVAVDALAEFLEILEVAEADPEEIGRIRADLHAQASMTAEAMAELRRQISARVEAREAQIAAYAADIGRLIAADRAKLTALDAEAFDLCIKAGEGDTKRIKCAGFAIGLRRSPASVEIDAACPIDLLPAECKRIKVEPDKRAILAKLKAGETITGARIKPGERKISWR